MIIKYRYEDSNKNKMGIAFDSEKLQVVREKIIENCSIVKHYKGKFDERTVVMSLQNTAKQNNSIIRNIQRDVDGNSCVGLGQFYMYDYSYDEYIPPRIVHELNCILKGKSFNLQCLLKPTDIEKEYDINGDIKDIINLLIGHVQKHDINKFSKAQELLQQQRYFDVEMPKESVDNYLSELRNCYTIGQAETIITDKPIDANDEQINIQGTEDMVKKK